MPLGTSRLAAALLVLLLLGASGRPSAAQAPPTFDALSVGAGAGQAYAPWAAWPLLLVTTPDGGAWAFFSAQLTPATAVSPRRLYAARFAPSAGRWLAAQPLPGGSVQFGPAAVVDGHGTVHLVYSDRTAAAPTAVSTLVYTHSTGDGGWSDPTPVAPGVPGHQTSPTLAVDGRGGLHVLWLDQRAVDPAARAASPANADLFASDLAPRTGWTEAVQVYHRPTSDTYPRWPHLVTEGDRLVAVWSIYDTASSAAGSAARVGWSARPRGDAAAWTRAATLVGRGGGRIGGLLLDLAADPRGGTIVVYGRRTGTTTALALRRLDAGAARWGSDVALGSGQSVAFPRLAVGADGTTYVVYDVGPATALRVAALAIGPRASAPDPETVLTTGEDGVQGQPTVAIGASGRPWVLYFHAAPTGGVDGVRCRRDAAIPASG